MNRSAEAQKRLADVEHLSRKPHQELHGKLLDAVLGAMDTLTAEEWSQLARRSPDRLLQSLAMSGRLAGYSEKQEIDITGSLVRSMSDSQLEAALRLRAEEQLTRLAAVPALADAINNLSAAARRSVVDALIGPGIFREIVGAG